MCGKWDKVSIKYNKNEDKKIFLQKTEKFANLVKGREGRKRGQMAEESFGKSCHGL